VKQPETTDHIKFKKLLSLKNKAPLALDPLKSALIVVDVQRWFTQPEHPLWQFNEKLVSGVSAGYFKRVQSGVLGNIQYLQRVFRSFGLSVIFTTVGSNLLDGRDLPTWMREFDALSLRLVGERIVPPVNHPRWQIDDAVAPVAGDIVLNKTSSGAFASTTLDQTLHNLGVNSLVVCGLTTAMCVTQTAREAGDRGFQVIIADDGCTELSEELHEAALLAFSWIFGRVRSTEEISTYLNAQAPVRGLRYS
jgi:nicotinamidase-related amidase